MIQADPVLNGGWALLSAEGQLSPDPWGHLG